MCMCLRPTVLNGNEHQIPKLILNLEENYWIIEREKTLIFAYYDLSAPEKQNKLDWHRKAGTHRSSGIGYEPGYGKFRSLNVTDGNEGIPLEFLRVLTLKDEKIFVRWCYGITKWILFAN